MYLSGLFSIILLLIVPWTGTYKPVLEKGSTKPGTCPEDNALCRRHYEAKCQSDEECSGKQKCCFYYCHFECKYTVEDRLSGKLGTCPVVIYQCTKTKPPDKCHRDRDCLGTLKCCRGICGKKCIDALNPDVPKLDKETDLVAE
ncbi:antileukoproteinase-like [Phascolarctos cinereus]|uniref:WAP four-disulfide core domain protein 12-like n=1 Tax=Phascolarctos cinereus TaxID=38626 RepID=A0A6P5K5E6_PHACI|nr:WAP four-disulfide core domain protein 12-like [Phascolarctos cinereus]